MNSEFLSGSENRGTYRIYLRKVIYCRRLREQLRSRQVNRERTLSDRGVKYIAETVTLPEIEDFENPREHTRSHAGRSICNSREEHSRNPERKQKKDVV